MEENVTKKAPETKSKKKIFYVITKSNFGGAQRYVFDLASSLSKEKYDITVVFGGEGALKEKLNSEQIKTISISSLKRDVNIFSDFVSLIKLISLFAKEKPDIIHINSSKIGGLAGLAGRIARVKKIIYTNHGWPFNEERGIISLAIIYILSWLTVLFSHKTITVSKRDEYDGKKMLFCSKKVVCIYNGIKIPAFDERGIAREKIAIAGSKVGKNIPINSFIYGFIGELHKNKGYLYALEAVSDLKKKSVQVLPFFVIIGEGEEKEKIENFIREKGIQDNVIMLGYITNASKLLKGFDAFILTSTKEGLPYVIIEAGMASVPVIATNVGGISEIIEDMKSGILVHRKNPKEILSAMQYVYEHENKRKEFAETLHKNTTANFSIEKMLDETEKTYLQK